MSQIAGLADTQFVTDQYQNAQNLNARIQLHQRFSTNKYGWHRWVFDQFDFPPQSRILELGCGTGELWRENIDRIPTQWDITLSDSSAGMLHQARQNLDHHRRFRFEVVDAQSIPFESESIDSIIANHMLYHVPDREQALSEIRRVLKPQGTFYASTVGQRHLQEIADLVRRFDPKLAEWGAHPADSFVIENGPVQLARWFVNVTLRRYEDSLLVTELAPLMEYILSGRLRLTVDQRGELANLVSQEFRRFDEKFYITKDSGIFVSRRSVQS